MPILRYSGSRRRIFPRHARICHRIGNDTTNNDFICQAKSTSPPSYKLMIDRPTNWCFNYTPAHTMETICLVVRMALNHFPLALYWDAMQYNADIPSSGHRVPLMRSIRIGCASWTMLHLILALQLWPHYGTFRRRLVALLVGAILWYVLTPFHQFRFID